MNYINNLNTTCISPLPLGTDHLQPKWPKIYPPPPKATEATCGKWKVLACLGIFCSEKITTRSERDPLFPAKREGGASGLGG